MIARDSIDKKDTRKKIQKFESSESRHSSEEFDDYELVASEIGIRRACGNHNISRNNECPI